MMKIRNVLTAGTVLVLMLSGSATAASAAEGPITHAASSAVVDGMRIAPGVEARGPVGPCSQQASGVRVWQDFIVWKFQNCNTYNIRIQVKSVSRSDGSTFWGGCNTVAPGKVLESWSNLGYVSTASYRNC
jgi:hypothetical protein